MATLGGIVVVAGGGVCFVAGVQPAMPEVAPHPRPILYPTEEGME